MISNRLLLAAKFLVLYTFSGTTGLLAQDSTLHLALNDKTSMVFSLLPTGTLPGDKGSVVEKLWVAQTELTTGQWEAIMKTSLDYPPSEPARGLSWLDFQGFVKRLNKQYPQYLFRLPTEFEWEYAASAGQKGDWFFGNDLSQLEAYAWTSENAYGRIKPVAQKAPNPWGLYDIYGNVWELCLDDYPAKPNEVTLNLKVRKGGSSVYTAISSRISYTYSQPAARGNSNIGVRLVMKFKSP